MEKWISQNSYGEHQHVNCSNKSLQRRQNFKRKTKRGVLWGRVLKYVLFFSEIDFGYQEKEKGDYIVKYENNDRGRLCYMLSTISVFSF